MLIGEHKIKNDRYRFVLLEKWLVVTILWCRTMVTIVKYWLFCNLVNILANKEMMCGKFFVVFFFSILLFKKIVVQSKWLAQSKHTRLTISWFEWYAQALDNLISFVLFWIDKPLAICMNLLDSGLNLNPQHKQKI